MSSAISRICRRPLLNFFPQPKIPMNCGLTAPECSARYSASLNSVITPSGVKRAIFPVGSVK
jgi:hypothetical protein